MSPARATPPDDRTFALALEPKWRAASIIHWSPAEACVRAAQLLAPRAKDRVLDVGSGVGKFCVLASLVAKGEFVGVELREPLVRQSEAVAAHFGAARARFIHADALAHDWSPYQALYFYNPFAELRFDLTRRLDGSVKYDPGRHQQAVATAREKLLAMPFGTRVVLHHGLGGPMPHGYLLEAEEELEEGALQLWVKRRGLQRGRG